MVIKSTEPTPRRHLLIPLTLAILIHLYLLFFVKYSQESVQKKPLPKSPLNVVDLVTLPEEISLPKPVGTDLKPVSTISQLPPQEFIPVENEIEETKEETNMKIVESENVFNESIIYSVFELTKLPQIKIPPEVTNKYYPPLAKKGRIEGEVLLECIITAEGRIEQMQIIKKAGLEFEKAALTMLQDAQVVIVPGEIEKKPVSVKIHLPIKFVLK